MDTFVADFDACGDCCSLKEYFTIVEKCLNSMMKFVLLEKCRN